MTAAHMHMKSATLKFDLLLSAPSIKNITRIDEFSLVESFSRFSNFLHCCALVLLTVTTNKRQAKPDRDRPKAVNNSSDNALALSNVEPASDFFLPELSRRQDFEELGIFFSLRDTKCINPLKENIGLAMQSHSPLFRHIC